MKKYGSMGGGGTSINVTSGKLATGTGKPKNSQK